ncbi:hypothetical protein [Paraburkholderia nemoris]|uniref:hypothetical protein n=1 Tax=Paraburkholderia nemoris TaxID=2793076 RepID=UPI0038B9DEEB
MWLLKTYVNQAGKCDVREGYERGTDDLQAAFDVQMEFLCEQPRHGWTRPKAAKLTVNKGFRDYFEVRIFADRVQQRPIGYFGPNNNDFTLLLWAIEKGDKLIPSGWHSKADSRRDAISNGTASAVPWDTEQGLIDG